MYRSIIIIHCAVKPVLNGRTRGIAIGVRAGGARGAAAPPNFGQLRFFGQREKIWAKPVFKDVSILFSYFKDLNINLKSA